MIFRLFVGLLALLTAVQAGAADNRLHLTSTEHTPFAGEYLENDGFATEIVKAAFARVGYEVQVTFYPWKRCLEMAKDGESDGVALLWYTEERTRWLAYSDSLRLDNEMGFFARRDSPVSYSDYSELEPYVIGYMFGYAYPDDFQIALKELRAQKSYNNVELMHKLISGEIDLAILGKHQGEYILIQYYPNHMEEYEFQEPPLETREHYIALSRKTPGFEEKLEDFNRGLRMIWEDGTVEAILTRHGVR